MPDIVRINGAWSDGSPLSSETYTKETFQSGREVGFAGPKTSGFEVINGQLGYSNFANYPTTIEAPYVRRGAFTQGPYISGYRQNRDVWYKAVFPDLIPVVTPNIYEQARAVLATSFRIADNLSGIASPTPIDSLLIDITMDYTMASNQNLKDSDTGTEPTFNNPPFRGFIGVWLENYFYLPSATPIVAGRASTVEPPDGDTQQYFNKGETPDFRTFSMKMRITSEETGSISDLLTFLNPGWHSISVRVSSRQTIRIHGGAIIVTPIR